MIRRHVQQTVRWLKRVVTQPLDELNRWQTAVRFAYDLGRYGVKQLRHDRAPQMAAALAFRGLFGLLPVLVVATVLVRSFIGIERFLKLFDNLLVSMKLNEVRIVDVAQGGSESLALGQWLEGLVGQAAQVNLAAIGWFGMAVVVYSAFGLMVTIENAFNIIYRAPHGRSWKSRIPLYWFVLTVSPVAIGVAAYLNGQFETWIASVETWRWTLILIRLVWTCSFEWLFVFTIFKLIPNTAVAVKPALVGSLVAMLLLEIGKGILGTYLTNAFSISMLYGSLGLIPLFMFWVYLMWLAVLFGLEVSATLQMLHGRRLADIQHAPDSTETIDPLAVATTVQQITENFHAGRHSTAQQIAEQTSLHESVVEQIMERLIDVGLLHRVESHDGFVSLAKSPLPGGGTSKG